MSEASPVIDALGKVRAALSSLLNHLNVLGAIVLAYALANPQAASELVALLPEPYRPYAPMLALGWWATVQYAKGNAIKRATAPPRL